MLIEMGKTYCEIFVFGIIILKQYLKFYKIQIYAKFNFKRLWNLFKSNLLITVKVNGAHSVTIFNVN